MSDILERAADAVGAVATPTYGNFIGGDWRPSHTGRTFESRNPANGDVIGPRVLADVLQRLEHAEVHGGLHVGAVATNTGRIDRRGLRCPCRRGGERLRQATGDEQRREDPMGERAQLADRRLDEATAVVEYQRFLDLWRHADADLPEVITARARLATQGGRG